MIFDTLDNLSVYESMIPQLKTVAQILEIEDLFSQTPGFHQTSDPTVRYNIIDYTTTDSSNPLEIHRKEADVQIILSGKESVICASRHEALKADVYDEESDCAFFEADSTMSLVLEKGSFVIFFPGEPHRGNILYKQPIVCRKVVFKLTME